MSKPDIVYMNESASDDEAILRINEEAFGPGRFVRAAERVREQGPHDPRLSFVARDGGEIVGSVRLTPVMAGSARGHLLGPLAVRLSHKNIGIGRELVRIALREAEQAGAECVILVGDSPYYGPLGFAPVAPGALVFPGPVDPGRILAASFKPGVPAKLHGALRWCAA